MEVLDFEEVIATDPPLTRAQIKDLKQAAVTLGKAEARHLVDQYYIMQNQRIRSAAQVRALTESAEPHVTLRLVQGETNRLETLIKGALDSYSQGSLLGQWARAQHGIGPVLAAGLIAHVDWTLPTVGHIWRFAGLDPSVQWLGKERGEALYNSLDGSPIERLTAAGVMLGIRVESLVEFANHGKDGAERPITKDTVIAALARRPHNATLKVLCWKIGESFVKVSGNPNAFYGRLYAERKEREDRRNQSGHHAETAATILREKKWKRQNPSRSSLEAGKLPQAQVHARACRWTVKLFLSHMHERAHQLAGHEPPVPWALTRPDGSHVHRIAAPGPTAAELLATSTSELRCTNEPPATERATSLE